jgi:glutamine---fructose-6-phosphate transaminase (isomerizing)
MPFGVAMEREIRQQPALLSANAQSYFTQLKEIFADNAQFDLVLLAARGSSDNAALYARYLIETQLGIPVSLAAPSVITRYKSDMKYPKTLVVGISQSGAAPDVSEVLSYMRAKGHKTLAITNTPGSRLTQEAEHSILLNAGTEESVAATKTYTSTLVSLYQMVRAMGAELPVPALPSDQWVETTLVAANIAAGPVNRCNPVFALARGFGFSTALETSLKLMECALVPCKAYSSADFEHGPKALAGHGSAAISYEGEMPGLEGQGCEILLAPNANQDERVAPVWDIIFGQWLSLQVARSRGLDPDQARHLNKVTKTL